MDNSVLDVIIVGAGPAGLSASYYLAKLGMNHFVFERGKIGESWRSQRWDSFVLNTANAINRLPGDFYTAGDPEKFSPASRFVSALNRYTVKFALPVKENAEVISLDKPVGEQFFTVTVLENGISKNYQSRQVIICSGTQNEKKVPAFAENLSAGIVQLHTSEYRNASSLPEGAVLVAGSGQSGTQIAEDLADDGRKVWLSTSLVPRVPRTYRGKDIMDWLIAAKFFSVRKEEIADIKMLHLTAPQLTGTGNGRKTISLQSLAQKGVTILGRMKGADDKNVFFQPDAASHVQFADEFSKMVKGMIDEFIIKNQLNAPPPEEDISDMPDTDLRCVSAVTSLDLNIQHINSIIWTTGFGAGFNYIKLPVLDDEGNPEHQNGLSAFTGLYFLGLPWLRKRQSSLIYGIKEDAEFITAKVYQYAQQEHTIQQPI